MDWGYISNLKKICPLFKWICTEFITIFYLWNKSCCCFVFRIHQILPIISMYNFNFCLHRFISTQRKMSKQEFDKVASMNDQRYKELLTEGKIEPVERLIKEWNVNYDVIKVSLNILFLYSPLLTLRVSGNERQHRVVQRDQARHQ